MSEFPTHLNRELIRASSEFFINIKECKIDVLDVVGAEGVLWFDDGP